MNLESSFIEKYEQLTTLKPVAAKLAIDESRRFFWLYYSGLGETSYRELQEIEQELVEDLIRRRQFTISHSTVALPFLSNQDDFEEKQFEVIIKQVNVND